MSLGLPKHFSIDRGNVKIGKIIRRFLLPSAFISLYYYCKFRCYISIKAEVELSSNVGIGRRTYVGSFVKIKASEGPLHIGNDVSISAGCDISAGSKGIVIGDDCLIGPHVSIVGNNYRYDRLDLPIRLQNTTSKGVQIGNDVWIGAGACILDGAVIGNGVIITPNAVIGTRIHDNAIVQGNPGKIIFTRR
jgi:acetyltransferase-like isoleucine patch superfamily enzyme